MDSTSAHLCKQRPASQGHQLAGPPGQQQCTAAYPTCVPLKSPLAVLSLSLSPPKLEQQFWQSEPAQHVCSIMDAIALGFTLANHGLLVLEQLKHAGLAGLSPARLYTSAAGRGLPLCFVVPLFLLPLAGLLQLSYMACKPKAYKQHRFAITVANRIARLAILCSHAIEWQEHVFACGGGRHWGSSTASRRAALDLLKYLVAPHLIFLNHINFWVPFRFSFPLQLGTVAVQLVTSQRLCVCHMHRSVPLSKAAQTICSTVRQASAISAGFLLGGMQLVSPDAEQVVCTGVAATAQLQSYSVTVLLLIIPAITMYVLELKMKVTFLRQWGGTRLCGAAQDQRGVRSTIPQQQQSLWVQPVLALLADNTWACSVLFVACLVGGWFACETVVIAAAPLSCNGHSSVQLSWQGLQAML